MSGWTKDELDRIGATHEVELTRSAPTASRAGPVTIWIVRSGHDLYLRSWRGPIAAWYRRVQARHGGHL